MKKLLLAACTAVTLSGCVTAEQMAAQDDDACHSYGAPTGSTAYFQCRMLKDQQHVEQSAAAMAQFNHGFDMMAAASSGRATYLITP